MNARDTFQWLRAVLVQRAKDEQEWSLTRRQRLGYTSKAAICLLLRLDEAPHQPSWSLDKIEVANGPVRRWQDFEFGESGSCDYLAVGKGWRKWWYFIGEASWP